MSISMRIKVLHSDIQLSLFQFSRLIQVSKASASLFRYGSISSDSSSRIISRLASYLSGWQDCSFSQLREDYFKKANA